MSELQKGISYSGYGKEAYNKPESRLALQKLADTGVDWIALQVTWFWFPDELKIRADWSETPTDSSLALAICQAHDLGLKIMLKPHVDYKGYWPPRKCIGGDAGDSSCRQSLAFNSDQWKVWFEEYLKFIEHYARFSTTHGVEQLCIGTELAGTIHQEDQWRAVIKTCRQVYNGPLTYAALSLNEAARINWWDDLDYIGVNFYASVHRPELWPIYLNQFTDLYNRLDDPRKILITEIGFYSFKGAANVDRLQYPVELDDKELDVAEQATAYRAVLNNFTGQAWLAGIFWWDWATDPFAGGACDKDIVLQDKPAEDVIRQWCGRPPRPVPPATPEAGQTDGVYVDGWQGNWAYFGSDPNVEIGQPNPEGNQEVVIKVTLEAWGDDTYGEFYIEAYDDDGAALVEADLYYWLTFDVRSSSNNHKLWIELNNTESYVESYKRPVNNCHYLNEENIMADTWQSVTIPFRHLIASQQKFNTISFHYPHANEQVILWIKALRLVRPVSP